MGTCRGIDVFRHWRPSGRHTKVPGIRLVGVSNRRGAGDEAEDMVLESGRTGLCASSAVRMPGGSDGLGVPVEMLVMGARTPHSMRCQRPTFGRRSRPGPREPRESATMPALCF